MKIVWTQIALKDLDQVWDYIASDNPEGAQGVLEKISKAVQALPSYPNLGRSGRVIGTKELVVIGTPFIIPYRIRKDRIEILAVIHGARRWPEGM